MEAFGYDVKGDQNVLGDIRRMINSGDMIVNWIVFDEGDIYYTFYDEEYTVTEINHNTKEVRLERR